MRRQKKFRSIRYKDFIDFDETIARFLLSRLKFFRKKTCSSPYDLTLEEWKDILDKMILSFELILNNSEPNFGDNKWHKLVEDSGSTVNTEVYMKWYEDRQKTIKEGLKLFAERFQDLWI